MSTVWSRNPSKSMQKPPSNQSQLTEPGENTTTLTCDTKQNNMNQIQDMKHMKQNVFLVFACLVNNADSTNQHYSMMAMYLKYIL